MLDHVITLNCNGRQLKLSTMTAIMGIINVADDSFCNVGKYPDPYEALRYAEQLCSDGAAILDIGGEATNPNLTSLPLSEQAEMDRVLPIIEYLHANLSIPLSVDTSKPGVMRAAVKAGAGMINDVRGLRIEGALAAAAACQVPVCLMHMAHPQGLDHKQAGEAIQGDVVPFIKQFLHERTQAAIAAGIAPENILLDPGFGGGSFGKTTKQNLQLLSRLGEFHDLKQPLVVGVSRKLFIGDVLQQAATERLYGSIAAAIIAAQASVSLLRVHDVKATADALRLLHAVLEEKN